MSDSSSPQIYATVFIVLSKRVLDEDRVATGNCSPAEVGASESVKAIAREIWPSMWEFDFSHMDMGCDEALIKLGLATFDDNGSVLYRTRDLEDWD